MTCNRMRGRGAGGGEKEGDAATPRHDSRRGQTAQGNQSHLSSESLSLLALRPGTEPHLSMMCASPGVLSVFSLTFAKSAFTSAMPFRD
eukprot:1057974-Rhodomonas_salina.1